MKVLSAALCAALLGQEALGASVELRRPLFPKLRRTQADFAAVQTEDKQPEDDLAAAALPASDDASADAGLSAAADVPVDADASAASGSDAAGSDGNFPALPAVAQMTGTSSDVLKALSSQAKILEAQVAQEQMENEAKLTREKTVFENKLKAQEQGNREVESENKQISKEIEELKAGNRKLKKKAESVEEGNKQKREELQALHAKLGTASDFVATLLKKTFDSKKEKELQVLSGPVDTVPAAPVPVAPPAVKKPTHFLKKAEKAEVKKEKKQKEEGAKEDDKAESDEDDEEEDDSADDDSDSNSTSSTEDEEEADSFMELASRRVHMAVRSGEEAVQLGELADVQEALSRSLPKGVSNPKDLLNVLSSGVSNLAKAHKSSDAKLKALFVAAFKKGTQRHQKLLAQQQVLNRTRASLQGVEHKLEGAVSHLEGRKKSLKEGLKSFGTYLQQLSRVALASQDEESHLLSAMPKSVAGPAKEEEGDASAQSADGAAGDDAAVLASSSDSGAATDADAAAVDGKDA